MFGEFSIDSKVCCFLFLFRFADDLFDIVNVDVRFASWGVYDFGAPSNCSPYEGSSLVDVLLQVEVSLRVFLVIVAAFVGSWNASPSC